MIDKQLKPAKLTEHQYETLSKLEDLICCELGNADSKQKRRRITLDQQTRLWKHIGELIDLNLTINGHSQEFEDDLLRSIQEHKDYCDRCAKGEVKCKCQVWNRKEMLSKTYLNAIREEDDEDDNSNEGGSIFVDDKDVGYIRCDCSTANYNFVHCNCKQLGLIN